MARTIPLVFLFLGGTLNAQQHPLAGTWRISYAGSVQVENGVTTVITVEATMTVTATADSLVATLVTDPHPELPARPALRLAAPLPAGDATFESRSKATIRSPEGERELAVVSTWTFRPRGDSLEGTVVRMLEGMGQGPGPQAIKGTRTKA
jgi:hypothetical protein